VPIYGMAQATGNDTCPGKKNPHAQTVKKLAKAKAASGDYEYLTLNRSWNRSTGVIVSSNLRPDVIGVRCDGRVDAWEIRSEGDTEKDLRLRLSTGLGTLPDKVRGMTDVKEAVC
jgi:hypothetical protein